MRFTKDGAMTRMLTYLYFYICFLDNAATRTARANGRLGSHQVTSLKWWMISVLSHCTGTVSLSFSPKLYLSRGPGDKGKKGFGKGNLAA